MLLYGYSSNVPWGTSEGKALLAELNGEWVLRLIDGGRVHLTTNADMEYVKRNSRAWEGPIPLWAVDAVQVSPCL